MADSFRNQAFLVNEGLNPSNVLEYFYESPFYANNNGQNSINELERKGIPIDTTQPGFWFELVYSNAEGKSGFVDESIFIIQKYEKTYAQKKVPREIFHVISGTISAAQALGLFVERAAAHMVTNFSDIYSLLQKVHQITPKTVERARERSAWPEFVFFEEKPPIDLIQLSSIFKEEVYKT